MAVGLVAALLGLQGGRDAPAEASVATAAISRSRSNGFHK